MIFLSIAQMCSADQYHYLPDTQVVDLKPQMRPEPFSSTLYTLPSDDVSVYLRNILLFDSKDEYERLPYVVGFDRDNSIGAEGEIAYTKGLKTNDDISSYSLLAIGEVLTHPDTGREIGIEAYVIGSAELVNGGFPQTILINETTSTIDLGTKIIPSVGIDLPSVLDVRYPDQAMKGYVLSIEQDGMGGGGYSVAVVSLGKKHGIKQGQVLNLIEGVREVNDPESFAEIELPEGKFGEIMIYKVADKISLGIVTTSNRMVVAKDKVAASPLIEQGCS